MQKTGGTPGEHRQDACAAAKRAGRPGNTGRMPVLLRRGRDARGTQAGCLCYCEEGGTPGEHRQDACAAANLENGDNKIIRDQ
jgi:hypothetical protein